MTDPEYTKLLKRLGDANAKYKALLTEAEDEYEERYGVHPSDTDNDVWIDVYHVGHGAKLTATEVRESDELHNPDHNG